MTDDGKGVTQNDVEAVKWFKLAVAQGDARAQNNFGVMNGLFAKSAKFIARMFS